jgi:hypothetical protein
VTRPARMNAAATAVVQSPVICPAVPHLFEMQEEEGAPDFLCFIRTG